MPASDQKINHELYHVIPRTLIFLFDHDECVLLLQGSTDKRLWAGLYNGIGGHVEPGEDILEAAYRELDEESGISDVDLQFCGQIMIDVSDHTGVAIFVFRGFFEGETYMESPEGKLKRISLDDLDRLPVVEDLPIILPKIVSFQSGCTPLIGKYMYSEEGKLRISFH